jgi:hypothetical protein
MSAALGLAVQALNASQMRGYDSLIDRLNREGDRLPAGSAPIAYTSFAAPTGAGTVAPGGIPLVLPGRALFVQQVTFRCSTLVAGRAQLGGSGLVGVGTAPATDNRFMCGPNLPADILFNDYLRSSDKSGATIYITSWLDPAVTGTHTFLGGATGFQLADSINFDAKKVSLMVGDSTWHGATGPTSVLTCTPWLINKFYRDQGQDTRYILKAYPGSNTNGHESYRAGGKYEFPQVDSIFYNLGINDAAQGVTTATHSANVASLIAWKQKRYPKAKLVIFGTTPVQDATQEAALAAYRTADQAAVVNAADPNILFCNLGNSFDRTVAANYATTDGAAGTRIHPVDVALTQLWESGTITGWANGAATATAAGLRAWLLANLPAI